ncbi:MAG: hypothetical protein HY303_01645, partial [Candidatus Wallbacteria bacterium]|nr:hypothetical protein [Candidatus Wallbacteria bacterium]
MFAPNGDLYFSDSNNNRVRKVDAATGLLSTVAGTGAPGYSGDTGPATSAALKFPAALALDRALDLFIADNGNHRVRLVDHRTGFIRTVVGTGLKGVPTDGPALSANLSAPAGLALDSSGRLYISDAANHVVLVLQPDGTLRRYAGTGSVGFSGDGGLASQAQLSSPRGLGIDSAGNLLVADRGNNRIRRVDLDTQT